MKDYQIWGFTYLNYGDKNLNAITGNKHEAGSEFEIPCFDGIAWFKANNRYFVCYYPKYKYLTEEQFKIIEDYCGFRPKKGEYGAICGALCEVKEVSLTWYELTKITLPVSKADKDRLEF